MKIGLIRCLQTEDMCPATTCLNVMKNKKLAFVDIEEDIELIGITTCGWCNIVSANWFKELPLILI